MAPPGFAGRSMDSKSWAEGQVLYSAHNLYCNSPEPGARMYQLVSASLWDSCCLQCRLVRRLVPLEGCHAVVAHIPQTTWTLDTFHSRAQA